MQSRNILLIFLLGFATQLYALQADNPLVDSVTYLDIAKAGDQRLVAVGDRGTIVYSDDGENWSKASVPVNVLLTAVFFTDESHGWAVGHDAVVLHSSDGGETWEEQYSDPLNENEEVTGEEAMADSGSDYQDDYDAGYPDDYSDEYYEDGSGDDFSYDYDAMDYSYSEEIDTSGAPLLDIVFLDQDRGLAVGGYGYLLVTNDGGAHWEKSNAIDNPDGWHLNGISASPESALMFAVGEKGILFRSTDDGASWVTLESPYQGSFFGVSALSDDLVLLYGLQGNLWVSADQGESWRQIDVATGRGLNDAKRLDDGSLLVTGNAGVLLRSFDQANSFSLRYTRERESISAIVPLDSQHYVSAGSGGLQVRSSLAAGGK